MTRGSVWIQQKIEGVKLYVYRSNVKDATTIYFLDGDQFEEPFNHWICKHQPALNFVPSMQIIEQMIIPLGLSRHLKPCRWISVGKLQNIFRFL